MSERQTGWILGFLLVMQLALVTVQVPAPVRRHTLLERIALRLVAPVAELVAASLEVPEGILDRLHSRSALREENQRLRAEAEALRLELLRLRNTQRDLERLSSALGYQPSAEGRMRMADILYADHLSRMRILLLHVGEPRARLNQPVVASSGLVGRVIQSSGPYAKVQLITDQAATVGARIERTRRQGLIRGRGPAELELELVPMQADVRPGDRVVTSGIDGVYPAGLPVGTVVSVEPGRELFHLIKVQPAVDFGVLDQVYLLDREPVPKELVEGVPGASP